MQKYPVCKYQYRDRKKPTLVFCEKKALKSEEDIVCHTVTFCQHDGMWHNSREYLSYCKLASDTEEFAKKETTAPDYMTPVSRKEMVITDTVNRDKPTEDVKTTVSHETIVADIEKNTGSSRRRK